MDVWWAEDWWTVDLVATESGHLVLPMDIFTEGMQWDPSLPEFYADTHVLDLYAADP